ncbi:MAG: hypothetical protein CR972_01150 [Candidatus Moraniibacteriota bacterium]|nr:MAG: hypothetical protein CR972_01150 [Candidatus Moranbacteria bacterium]
MLFSKGGKIMEKQFHIGDVLSVTTKRQVSPRDMEGIRGILFFLMGSMLDDMQIFQAKNLCKSHVLELHPQLQGVDASGVTSANYQEWIDQQIGRFGEYLAICPIPKDHQKRREILNSGIIVLTV